MTKDKVLVALNRAAQKIEDFTKRVNEGCRYLGTGVVHRRIT